MSETREQGQGWREVRVPESFAWAFRDGFFAGQRSDKHAPLTDRAIAEAYMKYAQGLPPAHPTSPPEPGGEGDYEVEDEDVAGDLTSLIGEPQAPSAIREGR